MSDSAFDECLIGIDVGTTSVKAALFDADGTVRDALAQPYPTARHGASRVEQDPTDWTRAVEAALARFADRVPVGAVRGIGLTSQVNTHLFVDAAGNPLAPAIVWQDGRAAAEAATIDATIEEDERLRWWGAPLPVDASHALARMRWMAAHEPTVWARTAHVLLPKDHCLFALTGERVSDPLSNIGLVGADSRHVDALLERVPGARERLPALADMTSVAGRVRAGLPFAGCPVAVGTMDAWAGLFGCGVTGEGHGLYLGGTSEILGIVSGHVTPTPGVLVMPRSHDITLHVGPTQSGGASQLWLCRLLGIEPEEMGRLSASHDPRRPTPLFLPHLQGERAPLWDADARGVFVGLDASSDRAALAHAVHEGVALSARWLLESLEASAGTALEALNVGGGGFRSDAWNRIRADTLGVTLHRAAATDPGTLGAAGLAAVATGRHASVQAAFADLCSIDRTWEPDLSRAAWHEERYALFRETYARTRELSHRWVASAGT